MNREDELGVPGIGFDLLAQPRDVNVYRACGRHGVISLASARKAIGGKKLESLKSLSVQAAMQRNVGNFQMNSDLELLVEMHLNQNRRKDQR